jgi:hypothetical protein
MVAANATCIAKMVDADHRLWCRHGFGDREAGLGSDQRFHLGDGCRENRLRRQ